MHDFYEKRKRMADEERVKDIDAQRSVRDKLAALAGGYLTGGGKSTGVLNGQKSVSTRGKNITVEVINIEDDEEDEIVAIDEADDENIIGSCNQDKAAAKDETPAESNDLKRILRSNLPDDEKATMLAKFGIRMNHPGRSVECSTKKNGKSGGSQRLAVQLAVEDATMSLSSSSVAQVVNNGGCDKNTEPEIIEID